MDCMSYNYRLMTAGPFTLNVNYDEPIEKLIKDGNYGRDWFNDEIAANYATSKAGQDELEVKLFSFRPATRWDYALDHDQILNELDKLGYRLADIYELLLFGAQYPDTQIGRSICIFGESIPEEHRYFAPTLGGYKEWNSEEIERRLYVGHWDGSGCYVCYYYLAVRKSPEA